jgi:uncharacterized protein YkwD
MRLRSAPATALAAALAACGGAGGAGVAGAPVPGGEARRADAARIGGDPATEGAPIAPPSAREEAAAGELLGLLNAARAERGLAPLARSGGLAAVARSYCAEMARTKSIAHDSPISGGPADRARKAGIAFQRLSENLALAPDPASAHDGLMRSPGHRANILDPAVTEVGIGAIYSAEDGGESLIVTQMFAAPPERIDPAAAVIELVDRLNGVRRKRGLEPFSRHPWLDARAAEALASCGASALKYSPQAEKSPPFRLLQAVMVEGGTMDQIADGLAASDQSSSTHLSSIGVAVAGRGDAAGDAGGACAVVIFAVKK